MISGKNNFTQDTGNTKDKEGVGEVSYPKAESKGSRANYRKSQLLMPSTPANGRNHEALHRVWAGVCLGVGPSWESRERESH